MLFAQPARHMVAAQFAVSASYVVKASCGGLKNPLIYQTGPKTSAKSGWSRSIWEKRCISGPSQSSRIVGSRS